MILFWLNTMKIHGGGNRMIKHDHNKGEFPFKKSELTILSIILSEKENDMKEDFKSKDPYKFIQVVELKAKIDGYLWMMQRFNDKDIVRKLNEI